MQIQHKPIRLILVSILFITGTAAELALARGGRGAQGGRGAVSAPSSRPNLTRPMPRPAPSPSRPSPRPGQTLRPTPVTRPTTPTVPNRPVSRPGPGIPNTRPGQPARPITRPGQPQAPNRPVTLPARPGVNPPGYRPQPTLPTRPVARPPQHPGRPNTLPTHRPVQPPHNYLPGRRPTQLPNYAQRRDRMIYSRNALARQRHYFGGDWYRYHPRAHYYWHRYPALVAAPFVWVTTRALVSWLGYPNYYSYNSSGYTNYDVSNTTIYYGNDSDSDSHYQDYYGESANLAAAGNIAIGSQEEQDALINAEWTSIGVYGLVPIDEQEPQGVLQLFMTKAGLVSGNYVDLASNENYPVYGAVDLQTMKVAIAFSDTENSPVLETTLAAISQEDSIAQLYTTQDTAVSVNLVKYPEK